MNVDLKQFKHFSLVSREEKLGEKAALFWAENRWDIIIYCAWAITSLNSHKNYPSSTGQGMKTGFELKVLA